MKNSGPRPLHRCIMRSGSPGNVLPVCVATICMHVLSLPTGKAVFRAWIRVDLWLPALPTASPWTTALGWWTPRHPPTAWRPIWWTAQQVTVAALCSEPPSPAPLLPLGLYRWTTQAVGSLGEEGENSTSLLPGNLLNLCNDFRMWGSHYILCKGFICPLCFCDTWPRCRWLWGVPARLCTLSSLALWASVEVWEDPMTKLMLHSIVVEMNIQVHLSEEVIEG